MSLAQRQATREERIRVSIRKAAERFRRAREEAGLTLRELGEKAGLAPSTIQKIENSKLMPSLSVCIRLADALNRSLAYFAEEGDGLPDVRFTAKGSARVTDVKGSPVVMEHVAEPLINPKMEGFLVRVAAGGKSGVEEPIIYRGEEVAIGVKGRIRFEIRGQEYVLRPGGVLHLKGDVPHAWENRGPGEALMYMICAFTHER
ncbi:MAG: helix-turn-helix domain-containing protein [Candidatus Binatia bacterium]